MFSGPPEKQKGKEMSSSTVKPTIVLPAAANGTHIGNGVPKQKVDTGGGGGGGGGGALGRLSDDGVNELLRSGEVMDPSLAVIIDSEVEREKNMEPHHTTVTVEVHLN